MAVAVLLIGGALSFAVGAAFPATQTSAGILKVTTFTSTAGSGEGAFNWLFALLVIGPTLIASVVLYATSELVAALRRSGRTRNEGGKRDAAATI